MNKLFCLISALLAAIILVSAALSGCAVPSSSGPTPMPAATPEPTLEIPDAVPTEVLLPDSFGFIESALSGMKKKAADSFKSTRNDLFIKQSLRYGFCGNRCFEYSYTKSAAVPVEIGGYTYAPARGLAEAFGSEYEETDEGIRFIYNGNCSVFVSASEDTVSLEFTGSGETAPFRRALAISGIYFIELKCAARLFDYRIISEEDGSVHMTATEREEPLAEGYGKELFEKYEKEVYGNPDTYCDPTGSGLYPPVDPSERLVGVAYTTWFRTDTNWGEGHTWDLPLLGKYASNDRDVIKQHGIWLRDAGVDFVFVDWSNDINYDPATMRSSRADFRMIEEATETLFDVWADIPGAPKICIFTGPGHEQGRNGSDPLHNGRMDAKTQQIYDTFIANERFRNMYFYYEGKPLLCCYAATPAFFQDNVSPYEDSRFTIRWITGYVGQQSSLFDEETMVSKMFWSWEERHVQTFTVLNGQPECMTVNAATRSQGSTPGTAGYIAPALRNNGRTFRKAWARADLIGPKIVLVVSFNEWFLGEQISPENSKDIEPSVTYGTYYLDLLRTEIRHFKGQ